MSKKLSTVLLVLLAVSLLVASIIFGAVAYDYVFEHEWSERPVSVFYDSNAQLRVRYSVHNHKEHERFLGELGDLAKGAGANDPRVQSLYSRQQMFHEIDMKVRPTGNLCAVACCVCFLLSLGLFYLAIFKRRRVSVIPPAETGAEIVEPPTSVQADVTPTPDATSGIPSSEVPSAEEVRHFSKGGMIVTVVWVVTGIPGLFGGSSWVVIFPWIGAAVAMLIRTFRLPLGWKQGLATFLGGLLAGAAVMNLLRPAPAIGAVGVIGASVIMLVLSIFILRAGFRRV